MKKLVVRSLITKQLQKCAAPLGEAERALSELAQMFPKSKQMEKARTHVLGVGADLQNFLKGKENAIEHNTRKQNTANG